MQQKRGSCRLMKRKGISTEKLKEYITESLMLLLKKKSFAMITIQEITAKAGVNRSTYYRNFTSKTEIIKYYFDNLHKEYYNNMKSDITSLS